MDLEHLEALALSDDRAAALAGLLPGTPEHDYWRGVHLQHQGRLDDVDAILAGWKKRHGRTDEHHARLSRRQLLLRAGRDLGEHADALRFEARVRLDDEAEAVTAAHRYPTRLDPALIDQAALVADARARGHELNYLTDWALPDLVGESLDATERRNLLQRLQRTDFPGLVALVAADLGEKSSRGFGSLAVHARLTRAQLDELAALRPELRKHPQFVAAVLVRLRPPTHVDWRTDLAARAAYLAELWAYVATLPPAFNALKAQVLYHQLDLDRRRGVLDRERFLRYLALPRKVHYVPAEYLRHVPSDQQVVPGTDAAQSAGLEPVPDDEPLVREYLEQLLLQEEGDAFAEYLRADWLEEQLATARLLAGAPEPERWAAVLGPARLAALRDRVDLELTVRNPARVAADAPVALEASVKNVPRLVVKTYRIDAVAHFLARRAEVDTTIDLDGLVASDEQVILGDAPAIQRVRRQIALPTCNRPGTYVIELIGGGKSSRALIRKGGLRHTVRVGVAGPTVRVLDDAGRPLEGARLWLAGREYEPRDDGAITIPFSTAPSRATVLLVHGDIAQAETLQHPAEQYQFHAGIHLERESLVPGKTARILLRPMLTVAGWPAPVALIEDPVVELAVTDGAGTTSTKTQPVVLRDDAETVVELVVPEDAAHVSVTARGQVRVASAQKTGDLADTASAEVARIHRSESTEALHLSAGADGHVLHLLGKTGEPRAGRAVALSFKHVAVTFELSTTLETDAHGRIELGALTGIERVTASLPTSETQQFHLWPELDAARTIHAVAGEQVLLPRPPAIGAGDVSLVELRGGAPARDVSSRVSLGERVLVVAGDLEAGEYLLQSRGVADVRIVVVPADTPISDGWAAAGPTSIELSPPLPLLTGLRVDGDHLRLKLDGAGPLTRVHVLATRYRPDRALPCSLRRAPRPPLAGAVAPVLSHYVSGRDIGDEYRYVLERRNLPRRPGMLLEKPGLLLNPWAVRTTTTGVQHAKGGGGYAASPPRPPAAPATAAPRTQASMIGEQGGFVALDFLPAPAVVLANLRPDASGELRVPLADLGAAQSVRVLVVDPALTSVADLGLPPTELRPRDLRLRFALAHDRHFTELRGVDAAPAGATLVVEDLRSGKLELVDTVARAHQVLLSLGAPDTLREFAFVTQWHALDDATRRARYSKYACHELHLFLYFRDPEFFARVVRPYLAHKRRKTFVDHWLLGADLSGYCEPWAFDRLNALERALLARRLPDVRESIVRLLGDAVDLIPPDPERDDRLVDTLLGASALEGGGVAAAAAMDFMEREVAAEPAPREKAKKRDSRARRGRSEGDELAADADDEEVEPQSAALMEIGGPPPAPAAAMPMRGPSRGGGDFGDATVAADLRERRRSAPLYRGADKTQEWAESDWWHIRAAAAGNALIAVNRYWRDFARHDPAVGPFLSPHLGECAGDFASALCALAVLDLPFVAGAHAVVVEDTRLSLTCATPALAARTRIAAVEAEGDARDALLVGQSYVRSDDRFEWDGAEQREKVVEGELLVGVVYRCLVVVTNPTSRYRRVAALLQIPRGALPVANGFYTRTFNLHLGPYATEQLEYAFYFPAPGQFPHFPAHVSQHRADRAELVGAAPPALLDVVVTPTRVDAKSWAHVSQHGTTDEVLEFLATANLGRVELEKIAWRMKDRDAFTRVLALLTSRRTYHDRLWAYALAHADRPRVAEWLRHQDAFVRKAGPVLGGGIVDLDPVERNWYEHLEYAPLITARAHRLGSKRQVLNDALAAQYNQFLELVAHRPAPTPDDLLAAAHYLFSLDRTDDALAALARVDPGKLATRLQYDYLAAYAACCSGDLAAARALAEPWRTHPVDRWRSRFVALLAMLDEAEGRGPAAAVDVDSREQRMDELAARQPALSLTAEQGRVIVQHHNVTSCQLRFYRMDIELLFSRQPFVQGEVERFSWIEPGATIDVTLSATEGRTVVEIPQGMRGANLVIDAVSAAGLRRSITHYSHDLATQLAQQYGQVKVLRASTQAPLPATYVKVYARQQGGTVAFYKDGYTDMRGRFDYATLSTDDLDRAERFAILVVSDEAGATVLEAPPPPR
ncbi:hypothetical protein SAMN02745121_04789 [Nannocystis exedens]|uniref:Uncharacterized protein n=1 Tax=Nannocystis exedens TaxID=54 RepID=A0A1I2BUI3_9BACT|nr:hypothetical protein [Nannocystis exedens]PCC71250.1 hypothetical protein NAEX_04324 [Nannocystis exedens]SFE59731.1 hypothetical protein SAMN02745121_04789 [Nannocystis exedens]